MILTREQAQAVADIVLTCDDSHYLWDFVEKAKELFPGHEWQTLMDEDCDPRPRIPPKPFIGPQLPNEAMRRMDRMLSEYAATTHEALSRPALL